MWDTKGLKGDHVIAVTADPAGVIVELDESNNTASGTVTVRGNKVRNGSFEQSSSGSAPDNWSASGDTSYGAGGTDGAKAASAGPGGTWTSDPIDVMPGTTVGLSVAATADAGTLVVEQIDAAGQVLGALLTLPAVGAVATTLALLTDATAVRVRLAGGLLGTTTFDDVRLWEE